jgi:hypothetical protein
MWKQLLQEASLQPTATLNIDELLRQPSVDQETCETLSDIAKNVLRVVSSVFGTNQDLIQNGVHRLRDYRYVDQVDTLICGRYIRWIRRSNDTTTTPKLDNGGMLSDVKFLDNGVHLSALSPGTRYPRRIKYDNYLIFQRLSEDEMMVLLSRELLHR